MVSRVNTVLLSSIPKNSNRLSLYSSFKLSLRQGVGEIVADTQVSSVRVLLLLESGTFQSEGAYVDYGYGQSLCSQYLLNMDIRGSNIEEIL